MGGGYVHGYDRRESERLEEQAGTLVDLLHAGTAYPAGSTVLGAGRGVGAQTVPLARRSPDARFLAVDVSSDSLAEARRKVDGAEAGFASVAVAPRMVYVDASRPALVEGFTRRTFTAMVEGARRPVVEAGLLDAERFDTGVRDPHRTTGADGVFCYTFFKGTARQAG